jgi:hypothetical protein
MSQPLKIEYDGQVYEFDELDIDVDEAETIQKYAGRSLGDWSNGVSTCEVRSLVALWWLLRKRAGQNPGPIAAKVPGFRPAKLFAAWAQAAKAEADRLKAEQEAAEQEPEPDPTSLPAGSSPASASTPMPIPAAAATSSLPG